MPFEPKNWVLVCDTEVDKYSGPQIETLKAMDLKIKGAIQCNDPKFKDHEACKTVPAFPAFCNTESQICVSGFRETQEHFDKLQQISDDKKASK